MGIFNSLKKRYKESKAYEEITQPKLESEYRRQLFEVRKREIREIAKRRAKKEYRQPSLSRPLIEMQKAFGGGQAFQSRLRNVPSQAPDLKKLKRKKIKPIKDYTPEAAYEPGMVVFRG